MRRTGIADLAVPFVVIGITTYVLLRFSYDSLPPLHLIVPLPLAGLAIVEFGLARRVRAAVRHDPTARPMAAIAIARAVALGKASSLVAAAVGGAAVALLVRVAPHAAAVTAASNDTTVSGVLLGSCILLMAAGLILERAGIDPSSHRDD